MGIALQWGGLAPSSIGSRVGQVQCASATGSSVTGSPYIIAIRRLTSSVVKVALATVIPMPVVLSPADVDNWQGYFDSRAKESALCNLVEIGFDLPFHAFSAR